MIRSFKADIYRLLRSKGTYICLGILTLIYALTLHFKTSGGIAFGIINPEALMDVESVKLDLMQLSRNFNFYYLLLMPVFMIIIPEFSEKTYKNTITSVSNKTSFFISKFILSEIVGLILFYIFTFGFYFINNIVNGSKYTSSFSTYTKYTLLQSVIMIAVIAFFIFCAFLFRKASIYNSFLILLPIIANLVCGLLSMNKHLEEIIIKAYNYEISNILMNIVFTPDDKTYLCRCIIGSISLTALFYTLGLNLFNIRELD